MNFEDFYSDVRWYFNFFVFKTYVYIFIFSKTLVGLPLCCIIYSKKFHIGSYRLKIIKFLGKSKKLVLTQSYLYYFVFFSKCMYFFRSTIITIINSQLALSMIKKTAWFTQCVANISDKYNDFGFIQYFSSLKKKI